MPNQGQPNLGTQPPESPCNGARHGTHDINNASDFRTELCAEGDEFTITKFTMETELSS